MSNVTEGVEQGVIFSLLLFICFEFQAFWFVKDAKCKQTRWLANIICPCYCEGKEQLHCWVKKLFTSYWKNNAQGIFILEKQCRRHMLCKLTQCVVWLRMTLQQLPAVCEKCYFPLAGARKKRKMFSHTLLGTWWNQGATGWSRLYENIFVVAQRSLPVSHPPNPFMFISLVGEQNGFGLGICTYLLQ
jgi:hypothetical protein